MTHIPATGADEVRTSTCYMCACRCGIRVHLREGRIRYIDGNPDHPVNRGVLCAKGNAGLKQHYSPARLRKPLLRVGERGRREFREIEWDEALSLATKWLGDIRARNPDELAFFTGRDQSQALTGWWAQQFGTVNYAAHGGFCSVNMAAGGLYSIGGSFWEFGEPDWAHTKYLMLWGVAEDHDSNPIKLGLGQLKARGAKIVAINPVRTGYGAIADEWVPIRPGTDGLLALALVHELLRSDRVDLEYLVRYTNAHWLVIRAPGDADDGLFARDAEGRVLCAVRDVSRKSAPHPQPLSRRERGERNPLPTGESGANAPGEGPSAANRFALADAPGIWPAVVGEYTLPDGRVAVPVFHLIAERYLDPACSPDAVAERCGVPAATIRRLAEEIASVAFDQAISLPIAWTDAHGRAHTEMRGRPIAMHAMRGISAHSNGFHTCRALHLLQLLLGAVDTPGSFRFQPPYPKPIPPPNRPGKTRDALGRLDAMPLGFVHTPADLLVSESGTPRRIDHAFSWAYPFAAHGMLHTVIRNACAHDPYPIDTLFLFMANMSWNSSMATHDTQGWLTARDEATGEYRIPRIIYSDAYDSEMVAFADLVLPDTTYLERYDAISLLDRPISDAEGASDAIRQPVFAPDRDVRAFQSVLLDLGARLGLPGMVHADGSPQWLDFADFMVRHERAPGIGLLAGWRGTDGESQGRGAINPSQIERYVQHDCFWHAAVPSDARYYKMANRGYLDWAATMGFLPPDSQAIALQLYSEPLQKFRLAALGHGALQPPDRLRERVATHFDPLPFWYEPFEGAELANAAADAPGPEPLSPRGEEERLRTTGPRDDERLSAVREGRGVGRGEGPSLHRDTHFARAKLSPSSGASRHLLPASGEKGVFPLSAITQRPMFMYHSWGSQNAWLRQIAARNALYVHPGTALALGIADGDEAMLESHWGSVQVPIALVDNVEPHTVWTWNAVGKRQGAWALDRDAPESRRGFMLNALIADVLPRTPLANADPVTGQAAWFDLRVRLRPLTAEERAQDASGWRNMTGLPQGDVAA